MIGMGIEILITYDMVMEIIYLGETYFKLEVGQISIRPLHSTIPPVLKKQT